jgi:hypothetical protein
MRRSWLWARETDPEEQFLLILLLQTGQPFEPELGCGSALTRNPCVAILIQGSEESRVLGKVGKPFFCCLDCIQKVRRL